MPTDCSDCQKTCSLGTCYLYRAPFGAISVKSPLLWPEAGTACNKLCKPSRLGKPRYCGIPSLLHYPDAVC